MDFFIFMNMNIFTNSNSHLLLDISQPIQYSLLESDTGIKRIYSRDEYNILVNMHRSHIHKYAKYE